MLRCWMCEVEPMYVDADVVWTSADGRGRFCYLVQDFSYLCGDLADCGAELSWKWDLREKNNEKTYEFL